MKDAVADVLIGDASTREVFDVIHDRRKIRHVDLTNASTAENVKHARCLCLSVPI